MDIKAEKVLVICGPTASGKTALALHFAQKYNGEIISADSMQVYKGLDIGTAKATPQERKQVPHHLIDIVEPSVSYSVAQYVTAAQQAIQNCLARGVTPIICGGTGLYISSLINGISFEAAMQSESRKIELEQFAAQNGNEALHALLAACDPQYAKTLHPNNKGRVIRGIICFETTGMCKAQALKRSRAAAPMFLYKVLVLSSEDRAYLYNRINARVDDMLQSGLLAEAQHVYKNRNSFAGAVQAIGYKEFFPYFEGAQTLEQCVEKLKQSTRNYAKRQLTWFRKIEGAHWLDIKTQNVIEAAQGIVEL